MAGLLTGLQSHWRCETGPGTLADEQANNNLVAQVGGQAIVAAKQGNGVDIPLNSYYIGNVSTGNYNLRQASLPTFTIGMWVRIDTVTANNHAIFAQYGSGLNEEGIYIDAKTDGGSGNHRWRIVAVQSSGVGVGVGFDVSDITAGVWHYVIAGHDALAGALFISVDGGAAQWSAAHDGTCKTTGAIPFTIGGWPENTVEWTDGDLDEISFWYGRAVTNESILDQLYNSSAGIPFSHFANVLPGGKKQWRHRQQFVRRRRR